MLLKYQKLIFISFIGLILLFVNYTINIIYSYDITNILLFLGASITIATILYCIKYSNSFIQLEFPNNSEVINIKVVID